jgi:hypothetical protein
MSECLPIGNRIPNLSNIRIAALWLQFRDFEVALILNLCKNLSLECEESDAGVYRIESSLWVLNFQSLDLWQLADERGSELYKIGSLRVSSQSHLNSG